MNRVVALRTRAIDALEGAEQLDEAAGRIRKVMQHLVSPTLVRRQLNGTDLGHPSHPMLVQLPIGLWTRTCVLDLIGLGKTKAARTLVGLGVLSALPALESDMSDWVDTDEAEARVGLVHATSNSIIAVICFRCHGGGALEAGAAASSGRCWAPPGEPGWLPRGTSGVFVGGRYGHQCVRKRSRRMDCRARQRTAEDLVSRTVQGIRVMVATTEEERFALADRCSHRGGPVSEGALAAGCVTCPWHGSQFELAVGLPVRGPASIPQPVYENRVLADKLELRRCEKRAIRQRAICFRVRGVICSWVVDMRPARQISPGINRTCDPQRRNPAEANWSAGQESREN